MPGWDTGISKEWGRGWNVSREWWLLKDVTEQLMQCGCTKEFVCFLYEFYNLYHGSALLGFHGFKGCWEPGNMPKGRIGDCCFFS